MEIINAEIEQIFWARPLTMPYMAAVFLFAVLWTAFVYRKSRGLNYRLHLTLFTIRLAVLVLLLAILFEPMAVVHETHSTPRRVPILLDVSQSMSTVDPRKRSDDLTNAAEALNLIDSDGDITSMNLDMQQRQAIANASRLDLATALLSQKATSTLQSLGRNVDISYHTFGAKTQLISDESILQSEDVKKLSALEQETSISKALEVASRTGESAPAAIVLVSDGIETGSSQRSEWVLQNLSARNIPVYTIPMGMTNPDDISIEGIVMQEVAYSGDRVPIKVQLKSQGYEKRTSQLSVLLNGRRVASRVIRFNGGLEFEDIDFRVDIYDKGAAEVEVSIEPFDDETSTENNRVQRTIRVVNEQINVLYIEGNARWEYRYLRAILKRDPRINATFIASNVGPEVARNSTEHIERFPNNREEAFQYDLVIIGDVSATFFTNEEFGLIEELIRDRGASLIMLCGPMHAPMSYTGTPLERMLPVQFDSESPWEKVADSVYPVLTPEGASSLVMTLENDPDLNDQIWSRMAPMDHLPPLLGSKPGATVLTVLSDSVDRDQGYPLVAWQRYGTGKCMSLATDRLWRLRYRTGDKYHWRVWSQCIQFMTLSRLMGEHKRIRLETDRAIYPLGSQTRLYAHVFDDNFDPVLQPSFEVFVASLDTDQGRQRVKLLPDRSHAGLFEGYFTPKQAGVYRLEPNVEDQRISNTTEFQISDLNHELLDTNTDAENLERIAKVTGGQTLTPRDFNSIENLIDQTPVQKSFRYERTLMNPGLAGFLFILLLGVEWIQRRRHDLP